MEKTMSKAPREFWIRLQFRGEESGTAYPDIISTTATNLTGRHIPVIEKTPEVDKALNRDHLFDELVNAVSVLSVKLGQPKSKDLEKCLADSKDLLQRAKAAKNG